MSKVTQPTNRPTPPPRIERPHLICAISMCGCCERAVRLEEILTIVLSSLSDIEPFYASYVDEELLEEFVTRKLKECN